MNFTARNFNEMEATASVQLHATGLEKQVATLKEWKSKAIVQLEYFQMACHLYNFYKGDEIKELLRCKY